MHSRKCIICSHAFRSKIDAALRAGVPFRAVCKQYGTSLGALSRHGKQCLGENAHVGRQGDTEQIQTAQKPFDKGVSGNPKGRPKGSRNRATVIAEQLLEGEAEAITRKAITAAKAGDLVAVKLCLERLLPKKVTTKDAHVVFELPEVRDMHSMLAAQNAILQAAARGEITPLQAESFAALIDKQRKLVTLAVFVESLRAVPHESDAIQDWQLQALNDAELEALEKIMEKMAHATPVKELPEA